MLLRNIPYDLSVDMNSKTRYTSGHHESVLRSHQWRTAANSAAYLLPHLHEGMQLLDIGCGPGTITVDLAKLVPDGRVIGIDSEASVLEQARKQAKDVGLGNVTFQQGNILSLDFPDSTFDVVHAHQVVQHVGNPVKAIAEMRRVVKPNGLVAIRETDFPLMTWYPDVGGMAAWKDLYFSVAKSNGGHPAAGRQLHDWAFQAGFLREHILASTSTWCFNEPRDREWWSAMWADRTLNSAFADQAKAANLADELELQRISQAWRDWGDHPSGWFVVLHGEVLCRRTP